MIALRPAAQRLYGELWPGSAFPAALTAALDRLERSAWPEIVATWSLLTPSGFPIEYTAGPPGSSPRWTAELAGPELPEAERLAVGAALLAADGPAVPARLLTALSELQRDTRLRYGTWLGGGVTNRKIYAELPHACDADVLSEAPLPAPLRTFLRHLPSASLPRILAVDAPMRRIELYARLPVADLTELTSLFHALDCPGALRCLGRLPDGLGRLRGRRLGLSVATESNIDTSESPRDGSELTLFVTARTMFPTASDLLPTLAPQISGITRTQRPGLVTLRLDPDGGSPAIAVGVTPTVPTHVPSLDH
ncbi:hypothetical protein [Amycolatopsis anabasis]|uniref:hypothetical protein n=1 Tax=Amycolatopsis anabasis TaxID=1840409 RepID=UPI00131E8802|nr:hypothetical protein [Amycolatopsis anabasis]